MEKRNLGKSGLQVSIIGLGCNNFGWRVDSAATERIVSSAIDHGVTFFDTADSYGNRGASEEFLGKAIGARRGDVVLATKFGNAMDDEGFRKGGSRRYVMQAVEASLRRLGTDWIDLYQLHFPDPATPVEETLRALEDLVRQGKIRYYGVSNMAAWQIVDAQWTARHNGLSPLVSTQAEYSLLERKPEAEMLPALEACGIGFLPYFPLASGLLTGKYKRDAAPPEGTRLAVNQQWVARHLNDAGWSRIEAYQKFAQARGRALSELAFAWLLSRKSVASVIAGATSPAQVEQNVKAADWTLDADELKELDAIG